MARPLTPGLFVLGSCLHCGGEFRNYASSRSNKRFCSKKCMSEYVRRDQKCETCGGPISVPRSHKRKYCSFSCRSAGNRLASGRALRNEAVATYLRHAKARGLVWALTDDQIDGLFAGDCHWCGDPPSNRRYRKRSFGEFIYNGIDRVNNSIGYVAGNVVSCCFTCNSMKRDFDQHTFITKALRIANKWQAQSA